MRVEYSSNNSGGGWWLKDEDWKKLEKAGWVVEWGGSYFCGQKYSFGSKKKPDVKPCNNPEKCPGHRKFESWKEMGEEDRWLGCLANHATKDFPSLQRAIKEFEDITGQDASDEGCNCCGAPHSFSSDGEYAGGEDVLKYLYDEVPSYRDAVKKINKRKKEVK